MTQIKLIAAAFAAITIFVLGFMLTAAHKEIGEKNEALKASAAALRSASAAISERDARIAEISATETHIAEQSAIQCGDNVTEAFNRGRAFGRAEAEAAQ